VYGRCYRVSAAWARTERLEQSSAVRNGRDADASEIAGRIFTDLRDTLGIPHRVRAFSRTSGRARVRRRSERVDELGMYSGNCRLVVEPPHSARVPRVEAAERLLEVAALRCVEKRMHR
jgi:hypothetical protein